jgi:uncharacterized protein (DUF488 family)
MIQLNIFGDKETSPQIFSVGYGRRPFKEFRKILSEHKIELIIDVRSNPNTELYGKEFLIEHFNYLSLPALGGLNHHQGHYKEWLNQAGVAEGLKDIIEWSKKGRVVLLCAELDHRNCHRFYFCSRALKELGQEVQHL